MSKEVKGIEEVLEILKGLNVTWLTVNKIKNSLWDTGVAFFDRSYCWKGRSKSGEGGGLKV